MILALIHLCIETRRSPLLPILAGSASYMSLQSFLHKELAYSILDLCIETYLSPLLLIRVGSASYMTLQSFLASSGRKRRPALRRVSDKSVAGRGRRVEFLFFK